MALCVRASTVFPLKASWEGKKVWECNIDQPESGSTKTLYQFQYGDERITADSKVALTVTGAVSRV